MAHFAEIDANSIVKRVIVISNNDALDEISGKNFISNVLGLQGIWIQASYNGNIRKNYPSEGYMYDAQKDAFIPPKPYQSWILNDQTCLWESPVKYPTDGKDYTWDETTQVWVQL